jgi:DNA-binding GntR family transcriptional regulator
MHERLRDVVAREVRNGIISGGLAPGERLREEALALKHGVSRVPAREALHLLAQEGFVDIVPRRGARVAFPSAKRTRELMVVREDLEQLAARLAARRRGGDEADDLRRVLSQGTAAAAERNYDGVPELIERFHDVIGIASGNTELIRMLRSIRSQVRWIFEVDLDVRSDISWHHHRAIAEAVLAGDEEAAVEHMRDDVVRDASLLVDVLVARG